MPAFLRTHQEPPMTRYPSRLQRGPIAMHRTGALDGCSIKAGGRSKLGSRVERFQPAGLVARLVQLRDSAGADLRTQNPDAQGRRPLEQPAKRFEAEQPPTSHLVRP